MVEEMLKNTEKSKILKQFLTTITVNEDLEKMRKNHFTQIKPGLYFIKVKNILSLKFKNNLIFNFIKELKKNRFLNCFIK